jgi:SAM-dependent methyltransferase
VLDVGSGDGKVGVELLRRRPDLTLHGVDVLVRPDAALLTEQFDGRSLPYEDNAFDAVLLIDVVHHADDPEHLLSETRRVASAAVVVKDHLREGALAQATLAFMDRVGNERHGVAVKDAYWSRPQWELALASVGLQVASWNERLGLYPWPASMLFERTFHFVARLEPS